MAKPEHINEIQSYIVACCADGKIDKEEYLYLKQQSHRYKIPELQLDNAIHKMLLNIGREKQIQRDFKSCVVYTKEALKFRPDNKETITILRDAIGSLSEDELLDLARTTIDDQEVYKNLLFEKIKQKGSDYQSNVINADLQDDNHDDKSGEHLSISNKDDKSKFNELSGRSGFVLIDEPVEIPNFPSIFRDVEFYKKGGMANIYTATFFDPDSRWHERKIIIKLLTDDRPNKTTLQRLFFKEYNILRDIDHSNIVKIIRRGKTGDLVYYLSEFINGKNLNELIELGIGLSRKDGKRKGLYDILLGILKGLQGIHEEGIIHRDIKPANILITNTANKVKIIDFGLAKTDNYNDKLKEAGTRPYNSPELRMKAYSADNRADIYSFGIILLELILGRNNKEFVQMMPDNIIHLKRIILKCTEEDIENRYNYIAEVVDELTQNEVIEELKWCSKHYINEEKQKDWNINKNVSKKTRRSKFLVPLIFIVSIIAIAASLYFSLYKNIPNKLEFISNSQETKLIEIKSRYSWSFSSSADWLDVNIDPKDENMLTIRTKSENRSLNPRTAILNIDYANGKQRTIEILQLGIYLKLSAIPAEITLGYQVNSTKSISIESNLPWQVNVKNDWISVDKITGNENDKIAISTSSSNPNIDQRTGTIVISSVNKDDSTIVLVNQFGHFFLQFTPEEISLTPLMGSVAEIEVNTNSDWEISEIPEYIKVSPKSGKKGKQTIMITLTDSIPQNQTKRGMKIFSPSNIDNVKFISIVFSESKKWTESDLLKYLEKIRGSNEPLDFDLIYEFVDPDCEVFYVINGTKLSSSDDIESFLSRVKLGSIEKIVGQSLRYNEAGKIIEFGQE